MLCDIVERIFNVILYIVIGALMTKSCNGLPRYNSDGSIWWEEASELVDLMLYIYDIAFCEAAIPLPYRKIEYLRYKQNHRSIMTFKIKTRYSIVLARCLVIANCR